MGAAFHCHAQDNDDFESFRSGLMDGFQSFRQEVLTGYTDFLRTAWEDFNVFRSESRDSKPKPRTAPTVDTHSPTTGKLLGRALEIIARKAKTAQGACLCG